VWIDNLTLIELHGMLFPAPRPPDKEPYAVFRDIGHGPGRRVWRLVEGFPDKKDAMACYEGIRDFARSQGDTHDVGVWNRKKFGEADWIEKTWR
jgi:hypothetical protein